MTLNKPLAGQRGIVLLTVVMLVFIITGASIATLYAVTASIKGTGYLRERLQQYYVADGGWQAVYGYMCARGITQKDLAYESQFNAVGLPYNVNIRDVRTVKRRVPGYSGELLGRDIVLESRSVDVDVATSAGTAGTEVLVFIGQAQVSGGYGNE